MSDSGPRRRSIPFLVCVLLRELLRIRRVLLLGDDEIDVQIQRRKLD